MLKDRTAKAKGEKKAGLQQRADKLRKASQRNQQSEEKWGGAASKGT
jgi:hypothetical protein